MHNLIASLNNCLVFYFHLIVEYGDGWISQTDLAERLPLKLFLNLIRTSYDHPDLIEYLDHPIKRYYLLRHLPDHLRDVLCIDKK